VQVLVADDDCVSRRMLEHMLGNWGYTVQVCADGATAWEQLQKHDAPPLVILDWLMPKLDGVQLCRNIRAVTLPAPPYIILVTVKDEGADIVAGLQAGADDYITKPYHREELRARIQVGARLITSQQRLTARVRELESALSDVKQLDGFISICGYCKKIRNTQNNWQPVESYITEHTDAQFSHGICPTCYEHTVKNELAQIRGLSS
jgi:phosphoserine phosphatase RsbU/P